MLMPRWFHTIQDLIAVSTNPSSVPPNSNPYTLANWTPDNKGWIITNQLVIGRIHNSSKGTLKARHYILQSDNTLVACQGCSLKNRSHYNKRYYLETKKPFYNLQ